MAHLSSIAAPAPVERIPGCAALFAYALLCLSSASYSSQTTVVTSSSVGVCSLTAESDDEWRTLRLRARHPEYKDCTIDKESMLSLLRLALARKESAPAGGYKTLYVGRLVDYPWMSSYLARGAARDPAWSPKIGKPVAGDINAYVDAALSRSDLTNQLAPALADAGYAVIGVTVEKVLVGSVHDLPGRLPFDAQVWFRIEKR
jgi:hypothetical protein